MNIINFLQSFQSEALTSFFKFITFFGDKEFYILVLPLLFWFWDKEKAVKLLYILLPSLLINYWIKELFHTTRPLGVALIEQGGFAFPSGHAQGSTTLWLMLAFLVRQKWIKYLGVIMIFLVSVSRMYLGVHYPIDIAGGILLGLGLVLVYDKYVYNNFSEYVNTKTTLGKAALSTIIILFFTVIYPTSDTITILAVLWGFSIILIFTSVQDSIAKPGILWNILTLIIGIIGILLIWKGLKIVLTNSEFARFVRYGLLGIWIATLPFIFKNR